MFAFLGSLFGRFCASTLADIVGQLDSLAHEFDSLAHAFEVAQQTHTTLIRRLGAMDAKIQAALDAVNAKIDSAVNDISSEIDEIKTLVANIPANGDADEVAAAIDAINARLGGLSDSVNGMSDAVFPTEPPAEPPAA